MPTSLNELLDLAYIAFMTLEEGLGQAILQDAQHRYYPSSPQQVEVWKAVIKATLNKAVKAA